MNAILFRPLMPHHPAHDAADRVSLRAAAQKVLTWPTLLGLLVALLLLIGLQQ